MTDLGTLGGAGTSAVTINQRCDVAGASETSSGEWHTVVWHRGVMTDLGVLGQNPHGTGQGCVEDINNWETDPAAGEETGFAWSHSRVTLLDPSGADHSGARAINNHGHIVGNFLTLYTVTRATWSLGPRLQTFDMRLRRLAMAEWSPNYGQGDPACPRGAIGVIRPDSAS